MKNNEWKNICAACAEGTPPERCAYYGDPSGCNAPTLGKHPEGDLAERLQDELEKAEHRIAELERATGSAAAMREALEYVLQFDATDEAAEEDGLTDAERIAEYADHIEECQKKARAALAAPPEPPSDAAKMRKAILTIKELNDRRPHDAAGYEINDIIEEALSPTAAERERDELVDAHDAIARLEAELAEVRRQRDTACAELAVSSNPCNAAAMRAALERIVNLAPEYPARGVDWNALAADAFITASSGLSAPARNCDRFATANDAVEGYIAAHPHDDEPDASTYGSWLFAPAAERKGENK